MHFRCGLGLAPSRPHHLRELDCLPLAHLDDGANFAEKMLQEELEVESGFLVDRGGNALDSTAAREAADGGFGDALDVVAKNLSGE